MRNCEKTTVKYCARLTLVRIPSYIFGVKNGAPVCFNESVDKVARAPLKGLEYLPSILAINSILKITLAWFVVFYN